MISFSSSRTTSTPISTTNFSIMYSSSDEEIMTWFLRCWLTQLSLKHICSELLLFLISPYLKILLSCNTQPLMFLEKHHQVYLLYYTIIFKSSFFFFSILHLALWEYSQTFPRNSLPSNWEVRFQKVNIFVYFFSV